MSAQQSDRRSGMALVTVLWTVALLSALAIAVSTSFREFAAIVAIDHDRVKADMLIDAGLDVAGDIVRRLGERPLTERETVITLGTGTVRISLGDEGGRININKAPVPVLAALLRSAGIVDQADALAQAIDAWRRATVSQPVNATGQNDLPAFTDVQQLTDISGMTPDGVAAIAPLATVFGDDKVNVFTAPPAVLSSLPGANRGQIDALLSARQDGTMLEGQVQHLLGPASQYVKLKSRPIARVHLVARVADGYRIAVRAVVVAVPEDRRPYRVLEWSPAPVSESSAARIADQN